MERALLAGDSETGVCLMRLEEGLDTGAVHRCATVPIEPVTTATALRAQLVEVGTQLLLDELQVHVIPVIFGRGIRFFEDTGSMPIELERMKVMVSPDVTHLWFRPVK